MQHLSRDSGKVGERVGFSGVARSLSVSRNSDAHCKASGGGGVDSLNEI